MASSSWSREVSSWPTMTTTWATFSAVRLFGLTISWTVAGKADTSPIVASVKSSSRQLALLLGPNDMKPDSCARAK